MHTLQSIKNDIKNLKINSDDVLMVHSSMKSIGDVDGRADTVINAFMDYVDNGLLMFPTLTYRTVNKEQNIFDPMTEPACVGILPNIFMKRNNVKRSLHPTHSVAAYGSTADKYIQGEEKSTTPTPWKGCWGRLYENNAKILFLGCELSRNTFLHALEEYCNIPNRLLDEVIEYKVKTNGGLIDVAIRPHESEIRAWDNYKKIKDDILNKGIAIDGKIGDAYCVVCDARKLADFVIPILKEKPDFFAYP